EALTLSGGEVLCGGRMLASVAFSENRRVPTLPQNQTHVLLRERLLALRSDAFHSDSPDQGAIHLGCSVLAVHDEGDSVRVRVASGADQREITASFVVAADGVRSSVRTAL